MASEKVRVGLIGLGKMGISHQAILHAHPNVELVGICDTSQYVLDILKKYTGIAIYSDFKAMIDTAKLEVTHEIPVDADLKPMGLAMTRDGKSLYVTTGRGKKLLTIELPTEKITSSIEVGARPWGVTLSPDEKYIFTANGSSNDVAVVDRATHAIVKKIKAGERPWGVITR